MVSTRRGKSPSERVSVVEHARSATGATTPRHIWFYEVELALSRAGVSCEFLRDREQRARLARWYSAGEAAQQAANDMAFVFDQRVRELRRIP